MPQTAVFSGQISKSDQSPKWPPSPAITDPWEHAMFTLFPAVSSRCFDPDFCFLSLVSFTTKSKINFVYVIFIYPLWFKLNSSDEALVTITGELCFPSSKTSHLRCDLPDLSPLISRAEEPHPIEFSVIAYIPAVRLMEELKASGPAVVWTKLTLTPTSPVTARMGPELCLNYSTLF